MCLKGPAKKNPGVNQSNFDLVQLQHSTLFTEPESVIGLDSEISLRNPPSHYTWLDSRHTWAHFISNWRALTTELMTGLINLPIWV